MSAPLLLAGLWFVAANLVALLPSRDDHWSAVAGLAACGVPLLGWLTFEHGAVLGGLGLALGAMALRWPLGRLARRPRA